MSDDIKWPVRGTDITLRLEPAPRAPLTKMDVISLLHQALAAVRARPEGDNVDAVFWFPSPPTRPDEQIPRFGIVNSMSPPRLTWGDTSHIILALEDFYLDVGFPSGLIWYANDPVRGNLGMGVVRAPKRRSSA